MFIHYYFSEENLLSRLSQSNSKANDEKPNSLGIKDLKEDPREILHMNSFINNFE